jgi:hypothetical protein
MSVIVKAAIDIAKIAPPGNHEATTSLIRMPSHINK